jgi:transposase
VDAPRKVVLPEVGFRARRADLLKLLYWDGTGLVMAYKRL